jgi:hypothetical protein
VWIWDIKKTSKGQPWYIVKAPFTDIQYLIADYDSLQEFQDNIKNLDNRDLERFSVFVEYEIKIYERFVDKYKPGYLLVNNDLIETDEFLRLARKILSQLKRINKRLVKLLDV